MRVHPFRWSLVELAALACLAGLLTACGETAPTQTPVVIVVTAPPLVVTATPLPPTATPATAAIRAQLEAGLRGQADLAATATTI